MCLPGLKNYGHFRHGDLCDISVDAKDLLDKQLVYQTECRYKVNRHFSRSETNFLQV